MVCLLGERFKFYFAWKVAEGASVLGGFGFEVSSPTSCCGAWYSTACSGIVVNLSAVAS
jgi:hypothetical protein